MFVIKVFFSNSVHTLEPPPPIAPAVNNSFTIVTPPFHVPVGMLLPVTESVNLPTPLTINVPLVMVAASNFICPDAKSMLCEPVPL